MREFFIEIGTEEIPAEYLEPAYRFLGEQLSGFFNKNRIEFEGYKTMGTPCRLIVGFFHVQDLQKDVVETNFGPSIKAAYDIEGNPTKSAIGFARGKGIDISALTRETTAKGDVVCARVKKKGRATRELLNEFLPQLIDSIPFPKKMRWGSKTKAFARPIKWIACLFGGTPLDFEWNGLACQNQSRGHRFLKPDTFACTGLADYLEQIENHFIIADPETRKNIIWKKTQELARIVGGKVEEDPDLLDEVSFLTEYPQPILCNFESRFLELPKELLVITMKQHQRYFPIVREDGNLIPSFITVSNMSTDRGEKIKKGNERVLRARLEDARFFYEEDRKKKLEDFVKPLKGVIFQKDLGSIHEKVKRVTKLSIKVANRLCPEYKVFVKRAAELCKADLVTQMVFEFPELQGIAGGYYARHSREASETALAIKEHYRPTFSGDVPPSTPVGCAVAIGDKLDTILGCIAVGLIPSGSADPYALRRHALGIIQITLSGKWDISLNEWINYSLELLGEKAKLKPDEIRKHALDLFTQRFKTLLTGQGFPYDAIDAVLSSGIDSLVDVNKKVRAFSELKAQPHFEPLAVTFRRVVSILTEEVEGSVQPNFFRDSRENELYDHYLKIKSPIEICLVEKDFAGALSKIVEIKPSVDKFFEGVLVMDKEESVRKNRLRLLQKISLLFSQIADFSKIVVKKS